MYLNCYLPQLTNAGGVVAYYRNYKGHRFASTKEAVTHRYQLTRRGFGVACICQRTYPRLVARDAACATRLKDRTLTKLYNTRPAWLADCHAKLDAAVAAAYGWPADLTDEAILERLLALNQAAVP